MMKFITVILTSLLSVAALFVITKLMGRRQIAQLNFFDYINGITMGSIAAELATELEQPWMPLTALVIYGAVSVLFSLLTMKFPRTRKIINGTPSILFCSGKLYRDNLKKAKLELSEFLVMCREAGYFDLSQISLAVYENNGKMSFLPTSDSRPVTPSDLSLSPPEATFFTEIIMDGRILHSNLKRCGYDLTWLEHKLHAQHISSPKSVFLAVADSAGNLSVY